MPSTSLEEARALVYDALNVATLTSVASVSTVLDFEPEARLMPKPAAVTVFATGVTPTDWLFAIRIYYDLTTGTEVAQRGIGEIVAAVETCLDNVGNVGPSAWTIGYTDGLNALVAQSDVVVGREDF